MGAPGRKLIFAACAATACAASAFRASKPMLAEPLTHTHAHTYTDATGGADIVPFQLAVGDHVAPTYTVNLDLPPEQRWVQPVQSLLRSYGFNATFGAVMSWLDTLVPASIQSLLEPFLDTLTHVIPPTYVQEIDGLFGAVIAEAPWANGTVLTRGKMYFMNLIYEFTAFCTSIVTSTSNGTILHGRNLDYDIPLANLTAKIVFTRNNNTQVAYTGTAFLGYVGLLTGMSSAFSVSVDQRDYNQTNDPVGEFLQNVASALSGGKSIGFFLRDQLETLPDWQTAVSVLNSTQLIAPVYLAVAGRNGNEGAIITRARDHADNSHGWDLAIRVLDVAAGAWYRDVTNYDFWVPDPPSDPRRTAAEKAMNATGLAAINAQSLFTVMSTNPVLNSGTIYTTIMCPSTGSYYVVVRGGSWTDAVRMEAAEGKVWNPFHRDWASRP